MPCYQINTVTLAFKAKNAKVIIEVLEAMELNPSYDEMTQEIDTDIGVFDLNTGKVKVASYYSSTVNDFRVNYSETILQKAAKQSRWVLKKRGQRKYVAKKW